MADKNNNSNTQKRTKTPDSIQDPPTRTTSSTQIKDQNSIQEDPESIREQKRRKNCPTSLETIQDSLPPEDHGNFSFTFDTKFSDGTPEFTPKFGSFKASAQETASGCVQSLKDKQGEEEDTQIGVVVGGAGGGGGGDREVGDFGAILRPVDDGIVEEIVRDS